MRTCTQNRRSGAVAVETAVVLSVVCMLIFGFLIGGIGVFRYQQVACLAQEGARWASVRGGDYQKEMNLTPPTKQQIVTQAVMPLAAGMNSAGLTVDVVWVDQGSGIAWDWDLATKDVRSITSSGVYVSNTVRVTVTYQWAPGILTDTITVQNVCEIPMSY
ncbi:TadE/TadG family type IV pilus assembly protein [Fimbriiglobus ruber]|uniref:TadE-like domain-containing protein n=1 Tax=Fimbriiglobus ruber TaxID=1908690 RepID=A0A225DSS0_9BACT|nr:TadE/TadG family type IV pilus assembly protein [Fimbriiglobus ruber]OWK44530.1 hypothetical protein FRUB_02462 [Fimbriiglobus ruber]